MRHQEANLQTACVMWFGYQYPTLRGLLFAVPNGGHRNPMEARRLKEQGTYPGVADLLLLKPCGGYGALCIEMKAPAGRQTDHQRAWQEQSERHGNRYVICRTLDEFRDEVNSYLNAG